MTGREPLPSECPEDTTRLPRVAVIVPAYGVAHLLGQALESLQAQTLQCWECIVIDDGTPDDVASAVEPFLSDPRIRFLATENHGVSAARNTAVAYTSAPFIALLDGDDLLRRNHLATMVRDLEADPQVRIVTCNARVFGAVPQEYFSISGKQGTGDGSHGSFRDVLDRSFNVYIGSSFRRADFDRIGGFDTDMAHAEDFDFWVRLMALGSYALYTDAVLGDYRVRSASASADTTKLHRGTIRTYQKLLASEPEAQIARLLEELISENERELSLESIIDRAISDETLEGLGELKRFTNGRHGPLLHACFHLWRHFPQLARPMLAIRKKAHSRGALYFPWQREAS